VFIAGGFNRYTPFARVLGYSLIAFTFAALVTSTIRARGTERTRWLRLGPLRQLGKICYGVYILQRPAEVILLRLLDRAGIVVDHESLSLVVLKMLFAIGVAAVSWTVFERQILRLKSRFASSSHPIAQDVPEPVDYIPTARIEAEGPHRVRR
jgi:peptidoglycan/LPS O-acetylase OafA/YrhL